MNKHAYTRQLNELSRYDIQVAGGKGASLGDMLQVGLPVPTGFVVTTDAFQDFSSINHIEAEIAKTLSELDHTDETAIANASEHITQQILAAPLSERLTAEMTHALQALDVPYLAVRSSATAEDSITAAWAGQLDSYLFVAPTDAQERIKHCWASLFSPRALFYCCEKGLQHKPISIAVVVQEMIDVEVSGVAFSVHPVTKDPNQIVIEAGWGIGEAIVSGLITPDQYIFGL